MYAQAFIGTHESTADTEHAETWHVSNTVHKACTQASDEHSCTDACHRHVLPMSYTHASITASQHHASHNPCTRSIVHATQHTVQIRIKMHHRRLVSVCMCACVHVCMCACVHVCMCMLQGVLVCSWICTCVCGMWHVHVPDIMR